MFEGRRLIITTKHKKESVIAPLLEKNLLVQCQVNEDFDTDTLGTFTGEIERIQDPISTARDKCLKGMQLAQCDLGIANEGSFGPHPSIPFLHCDEELIIFIDKRNQIEVIAREISTNTNFNSLKVHTYSELLKFATQAQFPSHGLILKTNNNNIIKGIHNETKLREAYEHLTQQATELTVETDMRAMYNPTRMSVIEEATIKLIEKITSTCPSCNWPGYAVSNAVLGLPCQLCGHETQSVLKHIKTCSKCNHSDELLHPYGRTSEDPMYCNFCNP